MDIWERLLALSLRVFYLDSRQLPTLRVIMRCEHDMKDDSDQVRSIVMQHEEALRKIGVERTGLGRYAPAQGFLEVEFRVTAKIGVDPVKMGKLLNEICNVFGVRLIEQLTPTHQYRVKVGRDHWVNEGDWILDEMRN
jgi:hypothetical protein